MTFAGEEHLSKSTYSRPGLNLSFEITSAITKPMMDFCSGAGRADSRRVRRPRGRAGSGRSDKAM
jgi:hypothetical protein